MGPRQAPPLLKCTSYAPKIYFKKFLSRPFIRSKGSRSFRHKTIIKRVKATYLILFYPGLATVICFLAHQEEFSWRHFLYLVIACLSAKVVKCLWVGSYDVDHRFLIIFLLSFWTFKGVCLSVNQGLSSLLLLKSTRLDRLYF